MDPEPLITERAGILVFGLLIGRTALRDSAVLGTNNGLMVHSVEPGSVGHDLEFDYWDILTTIDGRHYDDPEVLFMDLQEAQDSGHSVSVEILRDGAKKRCRRSTGAPRNRSGASFHVRHRWRPARLRGRLSGAVRK